MSAEEVPTKEELKEVILDELKEAEEAEEPPDPNFVCGVLLRMLPEGKGVNLVPVENDPDFVRAPTMDDLKVMGQQLADHIFTLNLQAKVLEGLQMAGVKLKIPGRGRLIN